ncbi:hypothetical protein ACU3L3_07170 [Priestia endophytica]
MEKKKYIITSSMTITTTYEIIAENEEQAEEHHQDIVDTWTKADLKIETVDGTIHELRVEDVEGNVDFVEESFLTNIKATLSTKTSTGDTSLIEDKQIEDIGKDEEDSENKTHKKEDR